MARVQDDQLLVPSVLDRLIDLDPANTREAPRGRSQLMRELKESVRRDLEHLLNTKRRWTPWPDEFKDLELSLMNYGIPDFTGASFASPSDRAELRRLLEGIIARFEPRFQTVKVVLQEGDDGRSRSLHFRVQAMLRAYPAPEPVMFDSQLEPETRKILVQDVS